VLKYAVVVQVGVDQRSNRAAEPAGAAKALVKGLAVLDLLTLRPGGLRLSQIIEHSGVPKGTALRLLEALTSAGAVAEDDHGIYRLGPRCITWGSAFLESVDLRRLARDVLARLADLTGETCHLGILDGLQVLYIDKIDGKHAIRMFSRIGSSNPLYCAGLGKAMLAFLPEPDVARVAAGLEPRTENTITDPEALRRELAAIRQRGYAIDDVENEEGVRCAGAPIFDHESHVVASISVAGPAYRMTRERIKTLGPGIRDAAGEVSRRLGAADPLPGSA
jgi:DNA-binding IclR family transcriptional regulator